MNVSNNGPIGPNGVSNRAQIRAVGPQYQKAADATSRRDDSDGIELSEEAKLLQKMSEQTGQTDEVRDKKVAELKAAVAEGRYPLSPVEIAKALLASRRNDNPA